MALLLRLACLLAALSLHLACHPSEPSTPRTDPLPALSEQWTWIPIEGTRCASGATAGIGINLSAQKEDLLLFLQGGGACWNQGTCAPSFSAFGPVCYYGSDLCLYDGAGGTQPLASHVATADPFPADGSGAFVAELAQLQQSKVFDRHETASPFKDATFVYVPYCTGDLHAGNAVKTYPFKAELLGTVTQRTVHFSGATNMERALERLAATLPQLKRVWLTGVSAGGYGATLNFERVKRHFPNAEVHLLADSSPFLESTHWNEWKEAWSLALPEGCADCAEGLPQIQAHLLQRYPQSRMGLLAFERDRVISYFFLGGTGPAEALNPPMASYTSALQRLLPSFQASTHAAVFLAPGEEHVMWPRYSSSNDLKAWIDAWATGSSGFIHVP